MADKRIAPKPTIEPVRGAKTLKRTPIIFALLPLGGCVGVLDPAGPVGAGERQILFNALAIMLAIVIPVIVATLGFAWWFRAGNRKATYRPDWSYSGAVEMVTWAIPVMIVLFLAGITWFGTHALHPAKPLESKQPPLEVQVVSLDWKWLFIYPEQGVASVNRLVIPVGRPVHFSLTSGSVMTAFFVPNLGSMIYTMNGMTTQLNLQADRPGSFPGRAAHFSGDGFSDMQFNADALPGNGFAQWVASTRGHGPMLDERGYRALAAQSSPVAPFTFGAVQPALFHAVAMQRIPQGPGPDLANSDQPGISPRKEH